MMSLMFTLHIRMGENVILITLTVVQLYVPDADLSFF